MLQVGYAPPRTGLDVQVHELVGVNEAQALWNTK